MNRCFPILAFAALPFFALAGPSEQIKANYALVDKCIQKMDIAALSKAFDSICTKNFMYQNPMMKSTLTQMKASFAKEFKTTKKMTYCKSTVSNIVFKGNEATLASTHKLSYVGKDGHNYTATIRSSDMWVKLGNTWKMVSETDNGYSMTKDGKAMTMAAMSKPAVAK